MEPQEQIWHVDENDTPIGSIGRDESRNTGERYRIVRVSVEDEDGNILLQKRLDTKKSFPGCWDTSAGGNIAYGESYDDAAMRELREETGIEGAGLTEVAYFYSEAADPDDNSLNRFTKVYKMLASKDIEVKPQPEEVAGLVWVTPQELREIVAEGRVTDGLKQTYERYYKVKMGKRALFLHGTGGSPHDHWWPWLKSEFEQSGYQVWTPQLPDSQRPSAQKYWDFLHEATDWDFADNVLVGHSSGATSVLNLLSEPDFPKVKAAVLVGVFLNEDLTSTSPDFRDGSQFAELFPLAGFDWPTIKMKAEKFYFIHGDNDPYCAYDDAVAAAVELGGELLTIPSGGHLSVASGVTDFPRLVEVLRRDGIV